MFGRQESDGRKWKSPGLLYTRDGDCRRCAEGATGVRVGRKVGREEVGRE